VGSFMRDSRRAPSWRFGVRIASVVAVVVGVLAIAGSGGIASASPGGPGTAITYTSSWAYSYPDGESGAPPGWMNPGFDASSWATDTAPFSDTTPVFCAADYGPAGLPTTANTDFPVGGTILLRKTFTLPADAWGLHLAGTIDNDEYLWIN
jgi:hypothetical protein